MSTGPSSVTAAIERRRYRSGSATGAVVGSGACRWPTRLPLPSPPSPRPASLRAAINTSNFLLVTGRDDDGAPTGVSPDMARELARRLGVDVVLAPYRRRATSPTTPSTTRGTSATSAPSRPGPSTSRSPPPTARSSARTSSRPGRPITTSTRSTSPGGASPRPHAPPTTCGSSATSSHAELVRSPELGGSFDAVRRPGPRRPRRAPSGAADRR